MKNQKRQKMVCTIKSKVINDTLNFSVIGSHYIYVDFESDKDFNHKQICKGGDFMGSTLSYFGESEKAFKDICKTWYRSYIADFKKYDYRY